ncbi:hypothetical protein ACH5RR_012187 [Cinchona calisaya]|uniref:Uncharacterized protein n=1 Tax=Cinchona calisaya TaxID=153742 RepID=A0ABD3A9H8_9GENT
MISEVVDHHDNQSCDDMSDFFEIDQVLSNIGEENKGQKSPNLHENPPTTLNDIEDYDNYECNTMGTSGDIIDQDGSMDQFLLSNIDFGIGDNINDQDHPNTLMLNAAKDDG